MRARLLVDVLVSRSEVRRGLRRARGAVRALRTAGHVPGRSRVLDRRLRDLGLLSSMDGSLSTAVRLLRPVRQDEPDLARLLAMAPLAPLQRRVLEGRLRGRAWHQVAREAGTDLGSASRALRAAVAWLRDAVRVHDALGGDGETGVHDLGAVARALGLSRRRVNAIVALRGAGPKGTERGFNGGAARHRQRAPGAGAGPGRAAGRAGPAPSPDPVEDDQHPANTPNPGTVAKLCPAGSAAGGSGASGPTAGSAASGATGGSAASGAASGAAAGSAASGAASGATGDPGASGAASAPSGEAVDAPPGPQGGSKGSADAMPGRPPEAEDAADAAPWFILAVRPGCALRVKVEIEERLAEVRRCCVPAAAGHRGASGLRGSYVAVQARLDATLAARIRGIAGVLGFVGLPEPGGLAGQAERRGARGGRVAPPAVSDGELRAFLDRLDAAAADGWDAPAGWVAGGGPAGSPAGSAAGRGGGRR